MKTLSIASALLLSQIVVTASSAGTCEGTQSISAVADDTRTIQLANGTRWRIARPDLIDARSWHPNAKVLTCDGALVNLDINEDTVAQRLH